MNKNEKMSIITDNAETIVPVEFKQKLDLRLNELRQENLFCDVCFEINGKMFPCHRLILVAVSPYFCTMFNGNFKESGSDIISLQDIEAETFEEILNAVYTCKIRLLPSNAYFILKASHLFLLEAVENACVSYIKEIKESVHYLVEICLFAKNIQQDSLYLDCEREISSDLVKYGRTDSFTQIPVDIFESILMNWLPDSSNCYEEEFTLLLISKWCKENGSRQEDWLRLFASSRLETKKYINPMVMARAFTMYPDDSCIEVKNQISADMDVHFKLNLYLDVIDVKTGQKGWGVLKINDKFDAYVLSSFNASDSWSKAVCKVGSKLYCMENFHGFPKRYVFSCYDEKNDRILLPIPEEQLTFWSYQLASMGTSIYLMAETAIRLMPKKTNYFIVWAYDCDLKTWKKLVTKETNLGKYDSVSTYTFLNGFFYVYVREKSRTCLISIDSCSLVVKRIPNGDLFSLGPPSYIYKLHGFDNKLALYAVDDDDTRIMIFDLVSEDWLDDEEIVRMQFRREKFRSIYHNDILYAIENDRTIVNEKYNLKTLTSDQLPSLPKRITFGNTNGVMVLATGHVFGGDAEETKN